MKPLTKAQLKQARRQIGEIGAKARARNLTPERRTQIARDAAIKRWDEVRRKKENETA